MTVDQSPSDALWSAIPGVSVRRIAGTRVVEAGSGTPLVLLHGGGGHAENFRHNVPAYAEHFRVLTLDLRWHGWSDIDGEPDQLIPELVEGVREVLAAEGIDRCFFEGQSMGGWVATRLALENPDLVSGLVLTTPMGLMDSVIDQADELEGVLTSQLAALSNPTTESIRQRMSGLFSDPSLLEDDVVEVRRGIYSDSTHNAVLRKVAHCYFDRDQVNRYRISDSQLAELAVPVLVYWGSSNDFSVASGQAITDAIPGATFHCAHAGHWAQYEQFTEHNEIVLDFLLNLKDRERQRTRSAVEQVS